MKWFKDKILERIGKYDKRRMVRTSRGWFVVYFKDGDVYCRHMKSVDKRYGLVYGKIELGIEIEYYNPRVGKKSIMGIIKEIKS